MSINVISFCMYYIVYMVPTFRPTPTKEVDVFKTAMILPP